MSILFIFHANSVDPDQTKLFCLDEHFCSCPILGMLDINGLKLTGQSHASTHKVNRSNFGFKDAISGFFLQY